MKNFLERVQENGPADRKKEIKTERVIGLGRARDSKVESNDSPETPDRGETSDIPGLPSRALPTGLTHPNNYMKDECPNKACGWLLQVYTPCHKA